MDRFKRYLQDHQQQLDVEIPGEHIWPAAQQEIRTNRRRHTILITRRWLATASLILLAGAAYLLLNLPGTRTIAKRPIPTEQPAADLTPAAPPSGIAQHAPAKSYDKSHIKHKADRNDPVELALSRMTNNYYAVIRKQLAKTRQLPLLTNNAAFRNDVKRRLFEMNLEEKEINNAIKKDGPN